MPINAIVVLNIISCIMNLLKIFKALALALFLATTAHAIAKTHGSGVKSTNPTQTQQQSSGKSQQTTTPKSKQQSSAKNETPQQTGKANEQVIMNVQTKKYHNPNCKYATSRCKHCVKTTKAEATNKGAKPCMACHK
jgi:hypothetical protein